MKIINHHNHKYFGLYTFNRNIFYGYIYVNPHNSKKYQHAEPEYSKRTCDTIHALIKRIQ